MKFCAWLLFAVLAIGSLGEALAPHRAPLLELVQRDAAGGDLRLVAQPPASLGSQPLRLRTRFAHYALGGHLAIEASGGSLFASMRGRDGPIPLGAGYPRCSDADASGLWTCRIPFRFEGAGWIEVAAVADGVRLHRFEAVIVKAAPVASSGLSSLAALLGGLSLLSLLLLAWPRAVPVAAKAQGLAVIGAAWLLFTGGTGALLLGLFYVLLLVLLRSQLQRPTALWRFAATLGFVIAALLLARLGIPWLWRSFADPGALGLGIPLGFAFVVIRAADLSLRVATRELRTLPARDYFTYLLFPATLAAGPIMTLPQFRQAAIPDPGIVDWSAGAARIGIGLAKKVVADILLTRIVAPRLALVYTGADAASTEDLAILLLTNALYVYLDFSAYSDIAIGIGRQLGWRVPENFEFPLLRTNMRSFWQSWHVTLSAWVSRWIHFFCSYSLRDAPPAWRSAVPVLASLLIIGLWHEIQWTWLLWGLHHALGILLGDALRSLVTARTGAAPAAVGVLLRAGGVLYVWVWLALSQCFTLISDPALALAAYLGMLTPWG
jgi:D-alanyl-lipoteichoic acid acyltransferase DltB (MBOAT superfamily)